MNTVTLHLEVYENMRDKIEELNKVIESYRDPKNIIVKTTRVHSPVSNISYSWSEHEESELKKIINNDINYNSEIIDELTSELEQMRKTHEDYVNGRKWYQFWK